MDPKIWGPHGWFFIDSVVLNYPDNPTDTDKTNMINFFNILGNMLPCPKCQINLRQHLVDHPLNDDVLKDKESLVKWVIIIHNYTNNKITFDNFVTYYKYHYNRPKKDFTIFIIIFVIIILVAIFTWFKK